MTGAGVALMAAAIVLFAIGFVFDADSGIRANVNVATIVCAYLGLVLALTARL